LWGPLVGVIPFTIIWEWVGIQFPNQSILFIGLCFLLIVYFLPQGVVGRLEELRARMRRAS
ncbi:MAG: branched-chain amino acid ABC transporter permease, partial [Rhodobacteraceae bacterium]|nr:branched-chain amino acid ABC transporter permease [Paracoccaceae bacterium]